MHMRSGTKDVINLLFGVHTYFILQELDLFILKVQKYMKSER
jgi:hypothetical protein